MANYYYEISEAFQGTVQRCAVANYYYEISQAFQGTVLGHGGRYFCLVNNLNLSSIQLSHELAQNSERIWKEEHGEVKFVKHRYINLIDEIPVDMKEFAWVKLASKAVNG